MQAGSPEDFCSNMGLPDLNFQKEKRSHNVLTANSVDSFDPVVASYQQTVCCSRALYLHSCCHFWHLPFTILAMFWKILLPPGGVGNLLVGQEGLITPAQLNVCM